MSRRSQALARPSASVTRCCSPSRLQMRSHRPVRPPLVPRRLPGVALQYGAQSAGEGVGHARESGGDPRCQPGRRAKVEGSRSRVEVARPPSVAGHDLARTGKKNPRPGVAAVRRRALTVVSGPPDSGAGWGRSGPPTPGVGPPTAPKRRRSEAQEGHFGCFLAGALRVRPLLVSSRRGRGRVGVLFERDGISAIECRGQTGGRGPVAPMARRRALGAPYDAASSSEHHPLRRTEE